MTNPRDVVEIRVMGHSITGIESDIIRLLALWFPSNFVCMPSRMIRLSDGEEIMTLAFFVLIQYRSVTDRQTDGQTEIPPLAIPPFA